MKYSIVIPEYNEEKNILPLYDELGNVINSLDGDSEVIFVDDGSRDQSLALLKSLAEKDKRIKILAFRRNFGQTAAMIAGFHEAQGAIIISLDADMQNPPAEIPRLIEKIQEGYDVVCGWRRHRKDNILLRRIPSRIANFFISKISGVKLHDNGCTLKAYRKETLLSIELYGEMHRFIPAYAAAQGARICEIEVSHRPRLHGETHYGLSRTFNVILDLLVMEFLIKYMTKPMHFFGGVGLFTFSLGLTSALTAVALKLMHLKDLVETPLPLLSAFFVMIAIQFVLMGIVSEMIMRTYYESQHKLQYAIKEKVNF